MAPGAPTTLVLDGSILEEQPSGNLATRGLAGKLHKPAVHHAGGSNHVTSTSPSGSKAEQPAVDSLHGLQGIACAPQMDSETLRRLHGSGAHVPPKPGGTKATGKVLRVNMGPQPRGRAPDSLDGPSHVSLQEGVKGQAITAAPVAEPAVASAASVPAGAAGGGAAGGGLGRVSGSGSAGPPALKVKRLELEVLARYQEINDSDSLCSTPPPVSQEALLRGSSAFNPAFGPLTPKPLSPSLLCTSGADWAAWADVPLPDMRECMSPQLPAST